VGAAETRAFRFGTLQQKLAVYRESERCITANQSAALD